MKIALFNIPSNTPAALLINEARKSFLETLLPDLVKEGSITNALDVGCGFGFFSGYLKEYGLKVMAIDGRPENVVEARRRNPDVELKVCDVEDPSIVSLGRYDLVFCFGLLYHLENPFRAVRNLASLTGKVLLVETVIAPTRSLATFLYEEEQKQDQGLNYIALIPSESWFIKCLYRAGFPFVYKTTVLPDHKDFRSSFIKKRRRTILVASKVKLSSPLLCVAPEPKTNRYMWDSLRVGSMFESERVRKILKSGLRLFSDSYRRKERK
jgi:SAM-dependent methyltransferase